MRLANHAGRAVILTSDTTGLDVHAASGGAFGPGLSEVYDRWTEFATWAANASGAEIAIEAAQLGAPSPAPSQIFAIGLNYSDHAAESGFARPEKLPPVFTKWQSALSGPVTTVALPPGGHTDWEVELVAIIGSEARNAAPGTGWSHVAGLTIGQDLSERITQMEGPAPQFGLGKSYPGFAPVGPWLVTPDEVPDRDDLELWAEIDGERVQHGRTSELIFPVPVLIEALSRIVTLRPGDLVFTGTPAGVGMGRTPQRFLQPGETLVSGIAGLGELRQRFVAG